MTKKAAFREVIVIRRRAQGFICGEYLRADWGRFLDSPVATLRIHGESP